MCCQSPDRAFHALSGALYSSVILFNHFIQFFSHKEENAMKRMLWVCLLVLGLTLSWTLVYAGDFYVIPVKVEKKNYAPLEKTGQKDCYYDDGTAGTCTCGTTNCPSDQDGDLEKGVTWPNPRFTDNGNGTVTDNLTLLIWLKDAKCVSFYSGDPGPNDRAWGDAIRAANALANGYCGLTDGSSAGDWRLPNRNELASLVDIAYYAPALSNGAGTGKWTNGNPFNDVQSSFYWCSSTCADNTSYTWGVHMINGNVPICVKSVSYYVWPVRNGN